MTRFCVRLLCSNFLKPNQEKYCSRSCSGKVGGKRTAQLHPNQGREFGKKYGKIVHVLHPSLARDNLEKAKKNNPDMAKKAAKTRKEHNPNAFVELGHKAGTTTARLHPNQFSEMGSRTVLLHPNQASDNLEKARQHYPNMTSENGKKVIVARIATNPNYQSEIGKVGGKRNAVLHPNQRYEMGRLGGARTKELYGHEFYVDLGTKSGNAQVASGRIHKFEKAGQDGVRRLWADPVRRDKRVSELVAQSHNHPNNSELFDLALLEALRPASYFFSGDGKVIIAGKNPDLCGIYERKLFEHNGEHWHPEDPSLRVKLFKDEGYDTFITQDASFKNLPKLLGELSEFIGIRFLPNGQTRLLK